MLSKIISIYRNIEFAVRNLNAVRRLSEIKSEEIGGLIYRGYFCLDADVISKIYRQLNDEAVFSKMQCWIYSRIGGCCLFVVEQRDAGGGAKIVGINMYYFNKRDIRENTIHEGFVGVLPEMSGRGIATEMRQMAIRHFKSVGLSGISTRISLNNEASLVSAKKMRFQPIEIYKDPSTGEKRYYMVCKF